MSSPSSFKKTARGILALGLVGLVPSVSADGPCDIYNAAGNTCVAAHSTTRALYGAYNGKLYQVKRASDNTTTDISTVSAGGIANSATQDTFCKSTTCLITQIYDQSGKGNHLGQATGYWKGPATGGYDNYASATGAPIALGGKRVYGVYIAAGSGYRRSTTTGVPTGNINEGMYDVVDGTHYNQWCCFDYGNSETSGTDTGAAHMEAIYFGNSKQWGYGTGNGPWIMADLENGLFSGSGTAQNADATISHRFVTAMLKGSSNNYFTIRGADATTGSLTQYVNSTRPSGYNPMHLEGAIILGTGGDNSNSGQGTWYEGAMVTGYPSDATENAVQANIAAAQYGTTVTTSGRSLTVGSTVSMALAKSMDTSAARKRSHTSDDEEEETIHFIAHTGSKIHTKPVSSSSSAEHKQSASWIVRAGLGRSDCFSFESADEEGSFIRHDLWKKDLELARRNAAIDRKQFDEDATFCPQEGLDGREHTHSLQSWNDPTRHVRVHGDEVHAAKGGFGHRPCDTADGFGEDASWVIIPGFL